MKHVALLVIAGLAAAQQPAGQDPPFQLPPTVEMRPDLTYASYGARSLKVDLFLPRQGAGPFPAVVYIHGGGWSGGSKIAFRRQAAHMGNKGFVGACIEYRLSGEAQFPAALHDAKAAVRWLRAHAKEFRVNPDRIGAAGGSAGGHLAAMLGTTQDIAEFEGAGGNAGHSSKVRAVAAFNPALDLVSFGQRGPDNAQNAVSRFLGGPYKDHEALWAKASPLTHTSKQSAAFLLLHGTGDTTVPYQQSVDMMNKLKAAGVHAEIFTAEGAGHGFFNRPPWYEPSLKRMGEFLTRMLR